MTNFRTFNRTQPLNHNFSFSIGNQKKVFNGKRLGYLAAITYRRTFNNYTSGRLERYSLPNVNEGLVIQSSRNDKQSTDNVLLGLMLNTSLKLSDNHKISLNIMHNRSGEDIARYQEGPQYDDDIGISVLSHFLYYTQKNISIAQLRGEHLFKNRTKNRTLKMEWQVANTYAEQDEPDFRVFTGSYFAEDGDTLFQIKPAIPGIAFPTRYFRSMNEYNLFSKLDFSLDVPSLNDSKLKWGGAYTFKSRAFREQQYGFDSQNAFAFDGDIDAYLGAENVWSSNNSNGVFVLDQFSEKNNYDATQSVGAAYAMLEYNLSEQIKLVGGARFEHTNIHLVSFDKDEDEAKLLNNDILPAINVKWSLNKKQNLRFSYARTLARPSFREIASFATYSFLENEVVKGNPNLKRTLVDNLDLRYEVFPNHGEIFSVGAFYKYFNQPIEKTQVPTSANREITFANVPTAEVFGIEFEARKRMFKGFNMGLNASLIYSQVTIDADELAAERQIDPNASAFRPLAGQSPYLVNAYINYELGNLTSNLSYNLQGDRLSIVSKLQTPDIYEKARNLLNLSLRYKFNERWATTVRVRNILDARSLLYYKGAETKTFSDNLQGRQYSVSFSYSLD